MTDAPSVESAEEFAGHFYERGNASYARLMVKLEYRDAALDAAIRADERARVIELLGDYGIEDIPELIRKARLWDEMP